MDLEKAYRVLEKVAEHNGIAVEEVIKNIEIGINEAIDTAIKENNEQVLKEWTKIPCVGKRPSAVEVIACLGQRLVDQNAGGESCWPFLNQ